jgi:hypothetical protein
MRFVILAVAIVVAVAVTYLGMVVGWAMDNSMFPPYGGGWRCYAACLAAVWTPFMAAYGLWSLPKLCRWIAVAMVE